jgi:hypothetical protein
MGSTRVAAAAASKVRARIESPGKRHRSRPHLDRLEDRTLLTGPTITIADLTVIRGSSGPAVNGYRINGFAGEAIKFHFDTTSSTALTWALYGSDNHVVAGIRLHG